MSMKKSNDTIGNRTRDLPACSAVPQPTALPRAPYAYRVAPIYFHPPPWRKSPEWARASLLSWLQDHTNTNTPHSVGLLWTSDHPDAETSTWQHTTVTKRLSMSRVGFELANPASERTQTLSLDRTATGIVSTDIYFNMFLCNKPFLCSFHSKGVEMWRPNSKLTNNNFNFIHEKKVFFQY